MSEGLKAQSKSTLHSAANNRTHQVDHGFHGRSTLLTYTTLGVLWRGTKVNAYLLLRECFVPDNVDLQGGCLWNTFAAEENTRKSTAVGASRRLVCTILDCVAIGRD